MNMPVKPKPVPVATAWTMPFWEGTRNGKLLYQKCGDCGTNVFIPRIACSRCFSENLEWVESSGRGTVFSFTVVENNAPSAFIADMPFVIAIVKLEEKGVQMLTNIVECDPYEVRCDMPVEVVFEKLSDEFTLPKFRPAATR